MHSTVISGKHMKHFVDFNSQNIRFSRDQIKNVLKGFHFRWFKINEIGAAYNICCIFYLDNATFSTIQYENCLSILLRLI